jgi:hypothetical protein
MLLLNALNMSCVFFLSIQLRKANTNINIGK